MSSRVFLAHLWFWPVLAHTVWRTFLCDWWRRLPFFHLYFFLCIYLNAVMTSEARTTFVLVEKLLQKLFTGWRVRRVSGARLNRSVYSRFAVMCLFVLATLQSVSSLVMKCATPRVTVIVRVHRSDSIKCSAVRGHRVAFVIFQFGRAVPLLLAKNFPLLLPQM